MLENNLNLIKKRFPRIYQKISKSDLSKKKLNKEFDNPEVLLSDKNLKMPLIAFFAGLSSTRLIDAFLKEKTIRCQKIFIVEKNSDQFIQTINHFDLTHILNDNRIEILLDEDLPFIFSYFMDFFRSQIHLIYSGCIETFTDPYAIKSNETYYTQIFEIISQALSDRNNSMVDNPRDQLIGLKYTIENLDLISQSLSIDYLKNLFFDLPGLVVSTGPSLNKSLDLLREIQNNVVIVAADSAALILLKNGIKPHFITCLERTEATRYFFENLDELSDTILVSLPVVSSQTLKTFKGPKMFLLNQAYNNSWFDSKESYEVGSSVSTMALKLLDILGCSTIYLLGQDLAYKRDSLHSHADGAHDYILSFEKKKLNDEKFKDNPQCWVLGNNNQKILTQPVYKQIAQDIAYLSSQINKPVINLIDKNAGMKIPFVKQGDPQLYLNKENIQKENITELLKNNLEKWHLPSFDLNLAQKNSQKISIGLKEISELCLEYLDELSVYSYKTATVGFYHLEIQKIFSKISFFEEGLNIISKKKAFNQFLWPFIQGLHFNCMKRYYQILGEKNYNQNHLTEIFDLFETWFTHVILWSERTHSALKAVLVKQKNENSILSSHSHPL